MSEVDFAPVPAGRPPVKGKRKAEAAIALRVAGTDYAEIARIVGYSNGEAAARAVEAELGRMTGPEERRAHRTLASARLETLLASVWPKASNDSDPEHLAAVRTSRDLIDRLIRLHGLDAPTEIVVHNPTEAELSAWVGRLLTPSGIIEADVIAGEIVAEGG